jgi:hypothetical protein
MDDIDKITRGQAAERLLADPLLVECLTALELNATARLRASDVNDTQLLQTLAISLQAISGFRRQLEMVARDGASALEKESQTSFASPNRRNFASIGA